MTEEIPKCEGGDGDYLDAIIVARNTKEAVMTTSRNPESSLPPCDHDECGLLQCKHSESPGSTPEPDDATVEWLERLAALPEDKIVMHLLEQQRDALELRCRSLEAEVKEQKEIARVACSNNFRVQHYFDALHDLRTRMSNLNFLSGKALEIAPDTQRKLYQIADDGMNPPPQPDSNAEPTIDDKDSAIRAAIAMYDEIQPSGGWQGVRDQLEAALNQ